MTQETTGKTVRYHKHISGEYRFFDLKLRELWRYRDLVFLLARRDFVVSYKQTILGPVWLILTPILTSLMYAFLFGNIAGIGTDGVPKVLFYLFSTAAWSMFSANIMSCAETFTDNAALMGKVYFPRLAVPVAKILAAAVRFLIQLLPAFAFYVYYLVRGEIRANPAYAGLFILSALQLALLAYGFGIVICALTTRYRDLKVLVGFGVSLWMFATPVAYPLSVLSGRFAFAVSLNPATAPMELMRFALWGRGGISAGWAVLSWIVTILLALAGTLMFNRVERVFTDTV